MDNSIFVLYNYDLYPIKNIKMKEKYPKVNRTEKHYIPVILGINKMKNIPIYILLDKQIKVLELGAGERIIKKHLEKDKNIIYKSLDIEGNQDFLHDLNKALPFQNNEYDVIICMETLEHIREPYKTIDEIQRVLKPNGILYISMPNEYNIFQRIYYLMAIKTEMDLPFKTIELNLHIHKPRIKDIRRLVESKFIIKNSWNIWQSRKGLGVFDNILSFMVKFFPNLFSRTHIIEAKVVK